MANENVKVSRVCQACGKEECKRHPNETDSVTALNEDGSIKMVMDDNSGRMKSVYRQETKQVD